MGKIVISENVSLDGVIQDPAGDEGFQSAFVALVVLARNRHGARAPAPRPASDSTPAAPGSGPSDQRRGLRRRQRMSESPRNLTIHAAGGGGGS